MTKSEAILEARRMLDAGEFNRGIVERMSESMLYDRALLTCGHRRMVLPNDTAITEKCWKCAEAWISEQLPGEENLIA